MQSLNYTIGLVGDGNTGKSTYAQLLRDKFGTDLTLNSNYGKIKLDLFESNEIPKQEVNAILLFMTRETLDTTKEWYHQIQEKYPTVPIVGAINKYDILPLEDMQIFALPPRLETYFISCAQKTEIMTPLLALIRNISGMDDPILKSTLKVDL